MEIYDRHTNLAEMMATHISSFRRIIEEVKNSHAQDNATKEVIFFYDHEIRALDKMKV